MLNYKLSAFSDEIDMNLETQMDVLTMLGISYIEIRGVNGKNITELSLSETKEIKKQLDKRGFHISSIGSPIGKISIQDEFEPHLELFRHVLEQSKILESPYIRMFSFYLPKEEKPEKFHDDVLFRWSKLISASRGSKIMLLHENEKDIYGDSAERCYDLIHSLSCDYVKAVFDPANFVQCDEMVYPYAFERLKDDIEYVHIKDACYKNHQVVPSGQGDGCIRKILSDLSKKNFQGFLSLEPHLGSFEGLENLELEAPVKSMPAATGSAKTFTIAYEALKKILSDIT